MYQNPNIKQQKPTNLLEASYFCKIIKNKNLGVNITLKPHQNVSSKIPNNVVFVVDVSSSMSSASGTTTRLKRVQTFAKSMISHLTNQDYFALVSFGTFSTTVLQSTLMNNNGKKIAEVQIDSLKTAGCTNLSSGLFSALDLIGCASRNLRDYIVLFTDGEANEGIWDGNALIARYREKTSELKGRNEVPLSVMAIEECPSELLTQLADKLGSDALFVIKENEDFENDLHIPVELRKSSPLVDITLKISCLQDDVVIKKKPQKFLKNTEVVDRDVVGLEYFMHHIPKDTEKNFYIVLGLPSNVEEQDEFEVLKIQRSFMNDKNQHEEVTDFVEINLKTIKEIIETSNKNVTNATRELVSTTCAYSMVDSEVRNDLPDAKRAYIKVTQEECRSLTIDALQEAKISENSSVIDETIHQIDESRILVVLFTGTGNLDDLETFKKKIEYFLYSLSECRTKVNNTETIATTQYNAILSSVETELPTAPSIFGPDFVQPSIPTSLKKSLDYIKSITCIKKKIDSQENEIETCKNELEKMNEGEDCNILNGKRFRLAQRIAELNISIKAENKKIEIKENQF